MRLADTFFTILDLETTGLDPATDEVIECAAWHADHTLRPWGRFSSLVYPKGLVPPFISGLTGITNADVRHAPMRDAMDRALREFIPAGSIIVAHNAPFDRSFNPGGESVHEQEWLCTKRLAMHLMPDEPSYSLQTLRYRFDPTGQAVDMRGLDPHRGEADVAVLLFVFGNLMALYERHRDAVIPHEDGDLWHSEDLLAFVNAPVIYKALPFGKWQNVALTEVPRDYLAWFLRSGNTDADLIASVKAVLYPPAP